MGFLQYIIRNDAMKTDPHEIYNWRVFALACAVRLPSILSIEEEQNIDFNSDVTTGLLWRNTLRHG